MRDAAARCLRGAWPALVLIALALLLEATSADRWVAARLHDPDQGWLGAGTWWAESLIHTGGRRLIKAIGAGAALLWLASYACARLRAARRGALYLALCVGLTTGIVAAGKQVTHVDCPRDLRPFGGDRPALHLFEARPADGPPGRCFPGGHSSGAFSLLGLYFLLGAAGAPGRARLALGAALALGFAFAFAQWSRGAHFPSHDLWSAAIAWIVALGLARGLLAAGRDRPDRSGGARMQAPVAPTRSRPARPCTPPAPQSPPMPETARTAR